MKRLKRSKNKILAGVCGGLAEYINPEIDPVVVRAAFVVLCFPLPFLIIVYLVMMFIVPMED